jgi:hypothetical protein
MHLEQANKLREMSDVTPEQFYSMVEDHYMLAYALCEVPNVPRPQLLYKMFCALPPP